MIIVEKSTNEDNVVLDLYDNVEHAGKMVKLTRAQYDALADSFFNGNEPSEIDFDQLPLVDNGSAELLDETLDRLADAESSLFEERNKNEILENRIDTLIRIMMLRAEVEFEASI